MTTEAWIVDAIRTPIGRHKGVFRDHRPDDLAADVLSALVKRSSVDPLEIDDVVMGCVTQIGEQGFNIARQAVLGAGFPVEVPACSVNRLCGSSEQAFVFAAQEILSGEADLVVAAGTESMTRVPMGSDMGPFSKRVTDLHDMVNQGIAAERVAEKWKLSREDLDAFSYESHRRAVAADFTREILSIGDIKTDEGPRPDTSVEKMATLKPVFKEGGIITAANSSQISDGAAALLLASPAKAKQLGLEPRARYIASSVCGVDPAIMLTGPIPSTQKVLKRAGLSIRDIDLFECNEAFAPAVLAWMHDTGVDHDRVNVNGGAIALGHPLGATGARLLTTLLHEMERRDVKRGLVTMCIGGGQGIAVILERP